MNIRDLKYVVAVSEHKHFGRAAAACFVSQPALSGQIRKMEEYLGVALFERNKREIKVTQAGERIIVHAKVALAAVGLIEQTAKAMNDPLTGELRVGMIPTIGPYLTPFLLPVLRRYLPKIQLQLKEDVTTSLERELIEGVIDVAILATETEHSQLKEMALYDEPFWVALPHGHPLTNEEQINVKDIQLEEFLLLEDGHCVRDQIISFCSQAAQRAIAVKTQHTSLTTILALVGAGAGVTLVPAMSLSGAWVTDFGITVRREKSGHALRSVRLVYRQSFPRVQVLERLADIIGAVVPDTVQPVRR